MKQHDTGNAATQATSLDSGGDSFGGGNAPRRKYVAPKVISSEELEVTATTCLTIPFGKTVPVPCSIMSS